MAKVTQRRAFAPGNYDGVVLTKDDLAAYVAGTRKALSAGISLPALKRHAPLAAGDSETVQFAATDGAGELTGVSQNEDGSLDFEFDIRDPETLAGIQSGAIRFTSPEFRRNYRDGIGRVHGNVLRHVALTPFPRNPHQGPMAVAMSEAANPADCFQCSYEGPMDDDEKEIKASEADESAAPAETVDPPKNPDAPPKATDKTKLAALVEGFGQLGLVLPSDFDISADNAVDLLVTAVNTALKAKETEPEPEPEAPEVKDEPAAMPFSESELAALPPAKRAAIQRMQQDALQFAEERQKRVRSEAEAALIASKLPKGLKDKLAARLNSVQFSEAGKELPTLTVQEAASLFSESLPPSLAFDESAVIEEAPPKGLMGAAQTDEDAEREAEEQLLRTGYGRRMGKGSTVAFEINNANPQAGPMVNIP